MSNLLIVESPAKAKTIKKYLGSGYKVVASMGHVMDLPKSKIGIDVENNFEPSYIPIKGKAELINSLKKEAEGAKKVYLATDPDREGEAISWHLATMLGLNLEDDIRVTFNEITKSAVQQGIKNARKLDMKLVDSQQARRVLDRLVGYKISPFLWRKVRKGLSAGRVQSVATRLIVDKEREIEAFVPKEYWNLDLVLETEKKATFEAKFHGDSKKKIEVQNEEEARKIEAALKASTFTINTVKKSSKKRNPYAPFITSTLQQDASRKFGYTSRRTMQIAQELYEGVEIEGEGLVGLITYMRTDSLRVSNDAINDVRGYISSKYGEEYLPKSPRMFKSKNAAQDAHEACRPTTMSLDPETIKKSLGRDQLKLYKLIWDRFVASQMESMVMDVVNVDIKAESSEKYMCKASGYTVKFKGFTAIYDEASDEEKEKSTKLPELKEGELLGLNKLDTTQHFTQPPARYNEASLIKALEENGIGRPSTYAPTISTITAREYVAKLGKAFKPTPLGIVITDVLKGHFTDIVDVEFTANMENSLDKIESGDQEWVKTISNFYDGFDSNLKKAEEELGGVYFKVPDEETAEVCDKCGKNMVIKSGRFGKFLACPGYPECKNTRPISTDTGAPCPKCGGKILQRVSKNKNKFYACENAPKCTFIHWYPPAKDNCELCGSILLQKSRYGKKSLICSNVDCKNGEPPVSETVAKVTGEGESGETATPKETKASSKTAAKSKTASKSATKKVEKKPAAKSKSASKTASETKKSATKSKTASKTEKKSTKDDK